MAERQKLQSSQIMTPINIESGVWPWPKQRPHSSPVKVHRTEDELVRSAAIKPRRRMQQQSASSYVASDYGSSHDGDRYSKSIVPNNMRYEINRLRHAIEVSNNVKVFSKDECLQQLVDASRLTNQRELKYLMLVIKESLENMLAEKTFETEKEHARLVRDLKQIEAKSQLELRQLKSLSKEESRLNMLSFKDDITRKLEQSVETTLKIERDHLIDLAEANLWHEAATFASSCLNQHVPTADRKWRDFFLVGLDKANVQLEDRYIVDREAKILEQDMDNLQFSERKTSTEMLALLTKSIEVVHRPENMMGHQRKLLLALPDVIIQEERNRNAEKLFQLKESLANFKSKEAEMNHLKAQVDVLTHTKSTLGLAKAGLENDLKTISNKLGDLERALLLWSEEKLQKYSAKQMCDRMDDMLEVTSRSSVGRSSQPKNPKDVVTSNNPGPGHDQGWQCFLASLKELDMLEYTEKFTVAGVRTMFGLMSLSIKSLKNLGLDDAATTKLRNWQTEQQSNTHGQCLPLQLPTKLSDDEYFSWLETEYIYKKQQRQIAPDSPTRSMKRGSLSVNDSADSNDIDDDDGCEVGESSEGGGGTGSSHYGDKQGDISVLKNDDFPMM